MSGSTVVIKNTDVHGKQLFIGIPYTSSYTFSTFAIRENQGKGNAVISGRLQLRTIELNCMTTGFLQVHVKPQMRDESVYRFTGRELGHGTNILGTVPLYTGPIRFPVLGKNTEVTVGVSSDSFLPYSLVNATWEGLYVNRNQRV